MGIVDATKNTALGITGRAKQVIGVAFGNRDLEFRGQNDEITANLHKARDQAKNAVSSVRKAVKL